MEGGSQRVSANMARSGTESKPPPPAMRAMTEDWTPPPRLMTVRDLGGRISLPPRRRHPAMGPSGAEAACPWLRT